MKTFVFSTDECGLEVFVRRQDAVGACEGIDVENGVYLFWDECGLPLEPVFSTPNRPGTFSVASGAYNLVPSSWGVSLLELLPRVKYVEGHGLFGEAADIRRYLEQRRFGTESR